MSNYKDTLASKSYLRYLEQKHSGKYGNSSFWMDDLVTRREEEGSGFDILKMVRYQRAISNFVKILGKKDIPVVFNSNDRSYTDGKTQVVLSANINEKSFDVHAGLALHEASHILHTDFDSINKWFTNNPSGLSSYSPIDTYVNQSKLKQYAPFIADNLAKLPEQFNAKFIFGICNFIEDRRIDNLVFRSSPGYKTYYHSLYEKYFWNKEITKALKSADFRSEDVNSYEFRLLGLINPATDPKALKGLRSIINKLDLRNIDRLKSTDDVAALAFDIADLIARCIVADQEAKKQQQQPQQQQPQDDKGDGQGGADVNEDGDDEQDDMGSGLNSPMDINASGTPTDGDANDANQPASDLDSLSPSELQKAQQKIEEMRKLINGESKKTKASKAEQRMTQAIAGTSDYELGNIEYTNDSGQKYNVPVLTFNLNPSSFHRDSDPVLDNMISHHLSEYRKVSYNAPGIYKEGSWNAKRYTDSMGVVNNGLRLGTMLGHKLQIRDQVRDTKHTRLKSGKIDGRLLHQCGYDVLNIFQKIDIDMYKPNVIHISIDASSSMNGSKWANTQTAVLAIAKACSMIQNIAVEVSYRYEMNINGKSSVVLVNAYNSKKHKVDHMAKIALLLQPIECTVDSLCIRYQLDRKLIKPTTSETTSYFINFSDGGPGTTVYDNNNAQINYNGMSAHRHIEKCRKDLEAIGVKVMSYFIGSSNHGNNRTVEQFTTDWGKANSSFIDVTELLPLAKSLNQMFLSK